jgi:hypothetical protein
VRGRDGSSIEVRQVRAPAVVALARVGVFALAVVRPRGRADVDRTPPLPAAFARVLDPLRVALAFARVLAAEAVVFAFAPGRRPLARERVALAR